MLSLKQWHSKHMSSRRVQEAPLNWNEVNQRFFGRNQETRILSQMQFSLLHQTLNLRRPVLKLRPG